MIFDPDCGLADPVAGVLPFVPPVSGVSDGFAGDVLVGEVLELPAAAGGGEESVPDLFCGDRKAKYETAANRTNATQVVASAGLRRSCSIRFMTVRLSEPADF
jgi:hypothetical protein